MDEKVRFMWSGDPEVHVTLRIVQAVRSALDLSLYARHPTLRT